MVWEKVESLIYEMRKRVLPTLWEDAEYLYQQLKQRKQAAPVIT